MSKQIDKSKLERIQEAAITMISRRGATDASVAAIAREAGVSVGYLYRHYASKEELMDDLLDTLLGRIGDRIAALVDEMKSPEEIVRGFVGYIFETAREKPDHVRFCLNLQNDLSCGISTRVTDRLKALCGSIRERGKAMEYIDKRITAEDLYVVLLCMPLQYIGVRMRGVFRPLGDLRQDVDAVTAICLSAMSPQERD